MSVIEALMTLRVLVMAIPVVLLQHSPKILEVAIEHLKAISSKLSVFSPPLSEDCLSLPFVYL